MSFRIEHVNLNVTDIGKSLEFYEKALGLKLKRKIEAGDGSFVLAFIGDEKSDFSLELTWLRDKEGPYELGDNETHIAFSAADFEAARSLHAQMDVICFENESMGIYFIEDPDGYWLEIVPDKTGNG